MTKTLAALVGLFGCGATAMPDEPDATAGIDRPDADPAAPDADPTAPDAPVALGAWSTPTRIDVLSTNDFVDSFPTIRNDGRELYFVSDRDGGSQDIYVSIRFAVTDPWGVPDKVLELDVPSSTESGPDLSSDGKTIWFSRRTASTGGMDLFTATRQSLSDPWGAVTPIAELNTPSDERSPHVTANGRVLYFASDAAGELEIHRATRANVNDTWGTPVLVSRLSSPEPDESTTTTEDGLEIYLDSRRDGVLATYRSTKSPDGGAWSIPEVVPELAGGFRADVTDDGRYMVLSALGDTGTSDVFEASR